VPDVTISFTSNGVIFLLVGLGRSVVSPEPRRFRRRWFVHFLVGHLLVTVPLAPTAYQNARSAEVNAKAIAEVQTRLADTSYKIVTVNVYNSVVAVTIAGWWTLGGPANPRKVGDGSSLWHTEDAEKSTNPRVAGRPRYDPARLDG
jgi:hypothetical protein